MTKNYETKDLPPPENKKVTNKQKILWAFTDAGPGVVLTGRDMGERTGINNAYVYMAELADRGLLTRVGKGHYALPSKTHPLRLAETPCAIDETVADDIRADERKRIASELAAAVKDAVPKESMEYIQGFRDGADFVAERVLGLVLDIKEAENPA